MQKKLSFKNNRTRVKTALRHKIILVMSGLLLCLFLIEGGLFLCGFILLSIQEHGNRVSLLQKGSYRIVCLGESTTAIRGGHSYPAILEEILNRRDIGVKFSIINKGVPGTDTSTIVSSAKSYLDQYKPDMVIAMMGINDRGGYVWYDDIVGGNPPSFFHRLRLVKLARLLRLHIAKKASELMSLRAKPQNQKVLLPERQPFDSHPQNTAAQKVISSSSADAAKQIKTGCEHRKEGEYANAKEAFLKAIEIDPGNDQAYVELAWNHIFAQYGNDRSVIEGLFKRAIALNPDNYNAFLGLGCFYTYCKEDEAARPCFEKAIALCPADPTAYLELGELFGRRKEYDQAVEVFTRASQMSPRDDRIYRYLAFYYRALGKEALAQEAALNAHKLLSISFDPALYRNYHTLKELLSQGKAKLVCVQYPMRNADVLKKIFEDQVDVVFVDNEKSFKDAVAREGYDEYFDDMFAGDFGHCTKKGNRLLAENVAKVILKEVFSK